MRTHGKVAEYLDGVLDADEEEAFLEHLAGCPACEQEMRDEIVLRAREDSLSTGAKPEAKVIPLHGSAEEAPPAKRRRWVVPAAVVALAAAAVLAWIVTRPRTRPAPATFALAAARSIEPRLAYGPAAAFRPYAVNRGTTVYETISPELIARLHRAGDCHGVAVGYTLSGEYERAATTFAQCGDGPDIDADRAALALLRRDAEGALRLSDRVLSRDPDHVAARWNRALALRDLGLRLAAAEVFEGLGSADNAWGAEALERSTSIRADLVAMRASWNLIEREGQRMLDADPARRQHVVGVVAPDGDPVIAADLARRHPGRARVLFHDAVRTARTRERLEELRPLAAALDGLVGENLERYIDAAQTSLTPARLALLDEYLTMIKNQGAEPSQFEAWMARARAAKADDLVLAALIGTSQAPDYPAEAARLAAASADPWLELGVHYQRVTRARVNRRIDEALTLLDEGDQRCQQARLAYRCLQLRFERAAVEHARYRGSSTLRFASETMREAEAIGAWPQRTNAAILAGDGARYVRDYALARAFYREAALAVNTCDALRGQLALDGEMAFDDHRIYDARSALASMPACEGAPSDYPSGSVFSFDVWTGEQRWQQVNLIALILDADLAMAGAAVRDVATIRADLVGLGDHVEPGSVALLAQYLTARLDSVTDPAAIERLQQIARTALARTGDSESVRVGMGAATAAMAAAGSRSEWSRVVAIAAEVSAVPPPDRCALVVAADDARFVVVALGADGTAEGVFDGDHPRPAGSWLAPPALHDRLRGCSVVDVLTTPAWFGVMPLLHPEQPWRYLLHAPRTPVPATEKRVIIAASSPPSSLQLPPLAEWRAPVAAGTVLLTGAAATPERVAAELRDATIIEFHVHSDRVLGSDAPALALSPGLDGWTLTAEQIAKIPLRNAPIVVLADCVGGEAAMYGHEIWGLPRAFLAAGARAVIAPLVPIPDETSTPVFAGIVEDIRGGVPAATAVAGRRAEKNSQGPTSWIQSLVVLE